MDTLESLNLIYRNPEVRGGMPCIVGTGLRVLDIVMAMQFGHRAPAQMANDYQVSLGKVHAALAYYYENKDAIDHDIREDLRIAKELVEEGWGKPEDSIFPLDLSKGELDELLALLRRHSHRNSNRGGATSAERRQIVRDFVAKTKSRQLATDLG